MKPYRKNRLLTDEDAKWKPRNKQAALVVRPASWINQPPAEPKILPSLGEKLAAESKIRKALIENLENESAEHQRELEKRREEQKANRPAPVAKCAWILKSEKQRRKRLGLPPLSKEEMRALRKAHPNYGIALSSPRKHG